MKRSRILLIALLFAVGCATTHSPITTTKINDKRDRLEVLSSENDVVVRQLLQLHERLATNSSYSVRAQVHDLDRSISIVQRSHDELIAERERLRRECKIDVNEGEHFH